MTRAVAVRGSIVILLACLPGCRREERIAELLQKTGTVEHDTAKTKGAFREAPLHTPFFVEDGVRTGASSSAGLGLAGGAELSLEANTLIRFHRGRKVAAPRLDVEMGQAELAAGQEDVSLETEFGVAVVDGKSRLSISKEGRDARFVVRVGSARLESTSGEATRLAEGEGLLIGIGAAILDRTTAPSASASAEPAPSAPVPEAPPEPTITEISGELRGGATVRAPGATTWTRLRAGVLRVVPGSTLQLPARATAALSGGGKSATLRGAGSFVVGARGMPFVQTSSGSVSLKDSPGEVTVDVPGGLIVAKVGARAEIQAKGDRSLVSVQGGAVEVRSPTGTETLRAGEEASLTTKSTEVLGRSVGFADLLLTAGESCAVHDPGPPTAIGFSAPACPSGTAVELAGAGKTLRASAADGTAVNVLVPAGFYRYSVRCIEHEAISDAIAAKGTLSVLADSGTARLPHSAPGALVDTDGRTYTVLYQSLLPKISVRWPGAPKSGSYVLEVASGSGATRSIATSAPAYSFVSGALTEGLHRFTYSVPGGPRSAQTVLDVRFDNGAPAASLSSPANGSLTAGSTTVVSGSASEGFRVSAAGRELPMDGQLRFSGEVVVPAGRRALAIRFAHPSRGIHYYLRRVSSQ